MCCSFALCQFVWTASPQIHPVSPVFLVFLMFLPVFAMLLPFCTVFSFTHGFSPACFCWFCCFRFTSAALIGQLTHVSGWLCCFFLASSELHFYQEYSHKLRKCVTRWNSVMSWCHGIKGGTAEEAFNVQCFLWERGASIGVDFIPFKIFYTPENI